MSTFDVFNLIFLISTSAVYIKQRFSICNNNKNGEILRHNFNYMIYNPGAYLDIYFWGGELRHFFRVKFLTY